MYSDILAVYRFCCRDTSAAGGMSGHPRQVIDVRKVTPPC
jgi:hypothetical protein